VGSPLLRPTDCEMHRSDPFLILFPSSVDDTGRPHVQGLSYRTLKFENRHFSLQVDSSFRECFRLPAGR
jgi:hypothetical protein